jgi:hypothetical protein
MVKKKKLQIDKKVLDHLAKDLYDLMHAESISRQVLKPRPVK